MNELLQKETIRPYDDEWIPNPYSEGDWITLKAKPNLLTDDIIDEDRSNLPDQILRGPIWNYDLWRSSKEKECCYYDLLYGSRSRKALLTQVSLVCHENKLGISLFIAQKEE